MFEIIIVKGLECAIFCEHCNFTNISEVTWGMSYKDNLQFNVPCNSQFSRWIYWVHVILLRSPQYLKCLIILLDFKNKPKHCTAVSN